MAKSKLSKKMKFLISLLINPKKLICFLAKKRLIIISDKKFLKIEYELNLNEKLNLDNPKKFNEKLQWLKLNDRKDIYTTMVDKYNAKKYIASIIGEEYIIPTFGIYNKFNEIDFTKLPNEFVIKCTHDSSGAIVVKDKNTFDMDNAKKKLNKYLKRNYFYNCREWPYKNVKPRIIVEKYIKDDLTDELRDYKFLCFNGKTKYVYVTIKGDNIFENYYDLDFNPVNVDHGFPRYEEEFKKPKNFDKMIKIAEKLSTNIPFLRVDLHNVDGKILFGECTFYDWAGFKPYRDNSDFELGKLIKLDNI